MRRATQGVHVVKLKEGAKVADVVKVPKEMKVSGELIQKTPRRSL